MVIIIQVHIMDKVIASKKFVVDASLERVWGLMGRVIINNLRGLEQMQMIDENNFSALLRVKMAFIGIPMRLRGQVVGGSVGALAVLLKAKGMCGMVKLDQKVAFTATQISEGKTEIICESVAQGLNFLLSIFIMGMVKSMAKDTLDRIEKRLKQIA
jgi:hypothetical protein